jgi:hypothetical protein
MLALTENVYNDFWHVTGNIMTFEFTATSVFVFKSSAQGPHRKEKALIS